MRNVSDGRPQHVVGENRESRVLANDWPIRTLRAETIENKTARFSARRLAVCLTSVTRVPAARKSDYTGASGRIGVSLLGSPPARAVRTMHRERLRRFPLDHGNRLIAVGADETGCSSDRFSHRRPTPVAWRRDDQPTNGAPLSAPNAARLTTGCSAQIGAGGASTLQHRSRRPVAALRPAPARELSLA